MSSLPSLASIVRGRFLTVTPTAEAWPGSPSGPATGLPATHRPLQPAPSSPGPSCRPAPHSTWSWSPQEGPGGSRCRLARVAGDYTSHKYVCPGGLTATARSACAALGRTVHSAESSSWLLPPRHAVPYGSHAVPYSSHTVPYGSPVLLLLGPHVWVTQPPPFLPHCPTHSALVPTGDAAGPEAAAHHRHASPASLLAPGQPPGRPAPQRGWGPSSPGLPWPHQPRALPAQQCPAHLRTADRALQGP